MTAAGATPPEWLVYDQVAGTVFKYLDGGVLLTTVAADHFFREFNTTLIQVTLTFLALVGLAGWTIWHLVHVRPRGEEQPPLWQGLDWYLIGLAVGGLTYVGLFRFLGLDIWFKGSLFTSARVVSIVLGILLPLYIGISLFLIWFLRLKSARVPGWNSSDSKPPAKKAANIFRFSFSRRKKGGDAGKS